MKMFSYILAVVILKILHCVDFRWTLDVGGVWSGVGCSK